MTDEIAPAEGSMHPDDNVCLCFKVSLNKLAHFMEREAPRVPSQLSECLGAGTGCGWCIPFLERLHQQWAEGESPSLPVSPERYASMRADYRRTGRRAGKPLAESSEGESESAGANGGA